MRQDRLLVVEDEPLVRQVIADNLSEAGYAVTEASSGLEALSLLEKHADFDLLLVDFVMPKMAGDEVARRANEIYPHLKVAFLTGYGEFLEVTGRAGQNPKIAKSMRARDLVAVVDGLLQPQARAQDA